MAKIMEVRQLYKAYGQITAVDGIDIEIEEGSCFGLLGPNGAGKTTTIEMMEGILKPDKGSVSFRGKPVDKQFKKKVGIQFQSTALPEFITVKETLELFSSFYPHPRAVEEVVELCSLSDILKRDNRKLSGGQRQRMLLGLAIIPHPEIIFLDEPTTGLDPAARRNFWQLINRIKSERTTVLLTTHYMEEAEILCDKIAIMDQGKILENDTPKKLIDKHFDGVLVRLPSEGRDCSSLGECFVVGDNIEIQTNNLEKTLKELLSGGYQTDGLSIHKPNLEDLFIKLTGSSLRS